VRFDPDASIDALRETLASAPASERDELELAAAALTLALVSPERAALPEPIEQRLSREALRFLEDMEGPAR